jgi:hypothetical protein
MTEIEKLLNSYESDELSEVNAFILLEMLISERKAYLRLREELKMATYELDDACAHHEIDVCHKKQCEVINRIIGDN